MYPARRRTQNVVGGLSPIQAASFALGFDGARPQCTDAPRADAR
jgi:hypothetical protein